MDVKPDIRWQLMLAAVCMGLLIVLLALRVRPEETQPIVELPEEENPVLATVDVCEEAASQQGGLLIEGIVGAPQFLNPLLSDHNKVDQEIVDLVFDGLLRYDADGRLVPALATDWTVSEDGRTVTFDLRENVFWHDGEPFTAADVAFTVSLLQDEAFPGAEQDKVLWQAVEVNVLNELQIAFTLPSPYSPFLAATTRGIVPQHLLAGATAATITSDPFNLMPVGTGPFAVANNWQDSGQLLLQPNPYIAQEMNLDGLAYRFYANETALLDAFAAAEIQAMHRLSPESIGRATTLKNIQLYTAPVPRYMQLLFNVSETGAAALKTVTVRQSLARSIDREQLVDEAVDGQGLVFEGPYLANAFAYDPNIPLPIAYDPISATADLEANGWLLPEDAPNGVRVRAAESEEAEDETLSFTLLVLDSEEHRDLARTIQQQWQMIGAEVQLIVVDTAAYQAALQTRAFDIALVEVNPLGDPDLYDFWSQEAIVRGQNYAGWNSRRASEALEAARQVWNQDERLAYYRAFLEFYDQGLPAFTLYQPLYSYAINADIENVDIGVIYSARSRYQTIAEWSLPNVVAVCDNER